MKATSKSANVSAHITANATTKAKPPKISFCITCMGRLSHLKATLLKNISDNRDYITQGGELEFVIVNYGAESETKAWVKKHLLAQITNGLVTYVDYPAAQHFKMSHAKNMAHRVASGDILCNLDADNFTGAGFASFIAKKFSSGKKCLRRIRLIKKLKGEHYLEGDAGRIVLTKNDFDKIGGYCEATLGWGGEDNHLHLRLLKLHKKINGHIPTRYLQNIPHNDELRQVNYHPSVQENTRRKLSSVKKELSWQLIFKRIKNIIASIKHVNIIANQTTGFGCGTVYINFSDNATKLEQHAERQN